MGLSEVRSALSAVIAGADPGSLVHDYERWANEQDAFSALFVPADQADGTAYIRAWLVKHLATKEEAIAQGHTILLYEFGIRFMHSLADAAGTEKTGDDLVETVRQAIRDNPSLGLAGTTVQPWGSEQVGAQLERNEYLQLGSALCHLFELRLIVQQYS